MVEITATTMRLAISLTDYKTWKNLTSENTRAADATVESSIEFIGTRQSGTYSCVRRYIKCLGPHATPGKTDSAIAPDDQLLITASAVTVALRPFNTTRAVSGVDLSGAANEYFTLILTIPYLCKRLPPLLLPALKHISVLQLSLSILLGAVGAVIHYMGYTPGLLIVGLFGIMIMWMYGYFWITGMLLVAGGCMCSLKHAQFVVPVLAMYAAYSVAVRVGWLGVFFTLNLSFLTNDLLKKLLLGYEGSTEERPFEETKDSDPATDAFFGSPEYPPAPESEPETVSSAKPFRSEPTQDVLHVQKEPSPSKIVDSDTTSLDEIKRIMDGTAYYEVMGIPRNLSINLKELRDAYKRLARLVHLDKNMGNILACESFKKLQSAYEVLSDITKKNSYDELLRKEESRQMNQRSRVVSQPSGVEFISEESRRIQCTKCGNFHLWICTKRSKAKARWCQDCSQYHVAKDGDGTSLKGMECKPNTHGPNFMVNKVGADKMPQRSHISRYPFSLDAEMIPEDEFELWLQQALATGVFADSPKRRKSWSPFKLPQKGMRSWRRSSSGNDIK